MRTIRVDAGVCIWLALAIYVLPLSWLIGAVLAAAFHELCHWLIASILNLRILEMTVGVGGMVMVMEPMPRNKELAVALAGPMGSFLLCLLFRIFPELAICGFVQGLFNLLPVYPLDGGRILYCVFGKWAERIEWAVIAFVVIGGVAGSIRFGIYPVLLSVLVTGKAIQRKFPCKESKLAVQ